jgi:hypothetical protein
MLDWENRGIVHSEMYRELMSMSAHQCVCISIYLCIRVYVYALTYLPLNRIAKCSKVLPCLSVI